MNKEILFAEEINKMTQTVMPILSLPLVGVGEVEAVGAGGEEEVVGEEEAVVEEDEADIHPVMIWRTLEGELCSISSELGKLLYRYVSYL